MESKDYNRVNRVVPADNECKRSHIEHRRIMELYLIVYDIVAVNFAFFFALFIRFDLKFSQIPKKYLVSFLKFAPVYTLFCIVLFYFMRLYRSIWRFASFNELNRITISSIITTVVNILAMTLFICRMPVSYFIMGAILQFFLISGIRFSYRFITLVRTKKSRSEHPVINAMVIGAGSAGRIIIRELKISEGTNIKPCCVIDDNPDKWGRYIEGVLVKGGRDSILEAVEQYHIDSILFAIPTASVEEKRDILNICKEAECELKTLPGVYQLVNGEVTLSKMKPVAIEDLLGRDPIKVNLSEIFSFLKEKTILVTGGGGSIGSEICRQIAAHNPKQLIIVDIYENNAYDIEQELKRNYPELNLVVLIASVRDSRRIEDIFENYKPEIVYHAAAHKHVPLMEGSPNEAIKNNVVGTYKTAYAAMKNGAQRFVLISTDKAVNPTNIMGASKRLCEMVIQSMDVISREGRMDLLPLLHDHKDNLQSTSVSIDPIDEIETGDMPENLTFENIKNKDRKGTQFVAVRFGNVLGSNGSVIPLFKKQIEAGGPVTVTHPDIIRYFMTIPEAVSLVLEAGTYARGGEIFVLDMGEPVKIDDLARNLIKLCGYKPNENMKIEYTGLRPGEKLYEEKLMKEEGMMKTDNELIHIGKPIQFDVKDFLTQLDKLARASYNNNENIAEMVEGIVPTYHPGGEVENRVS